MDLKLRDLTTTARILNISIRSVVRLIDSGQLVAYRLGPKNCIRIPQAEIERHIESCAIRPDCSN